MYDVIVIGAGPIGLYLATKFKERGYSVLVLEKKERIGEKPCTGLVSPHIFSFVPKEDFYIEREFSRAIIWIEDKPFRFFGRAVLLNRQRFDQYLFEKAKAKGVEIVLKQSALKVEETKDFVSVITKDKKIFKGKIVAGCDGALSTVGQQLGFPFQKRLLLGVITYLPNKKLLQQQEAPELFFSKEFPGFFAWQVPRSNCIEYGLALEVKYKPKERLIRFLRDKFKITNLKDFRISLIPFYPLKKTIKERVFLCGDAAGQNKPYTGGGLVYGLTCAQIASDIIDPDAPDFEIYEKKWRKILQREIFFEDLIRRCYRLPNLIKRIALRFLSQKKNLDQDRLLNSIFFQ